MQWVKTRYVLTVLLVYIILFGGTAAEAVSKLELRLLEDRDWKNRAQAAVNLGLSGDESAVDPLIARLQRDTHEVVRTRAAEALGLLGEPRAIDALEAAFHDPSFMVQVFAAEALGLLGDDRVFDFLAALVHHDELYVRQRVVNVFSHDGFAGDIRVIEPLILLLRDPEQTIRWQATWGLGHHQDPQTIAPLIERLTTDQDSDVRGLAASALGEHGDVRAFDALVQALQDDSGYVRQHAVDALRLLGDTRAIPPLSILLQNEEDVEIRALAEQALRHLE